MGCQCEAVSYYIFTSLLYLWPTFYKCLFLNVSIFIVGIHFSFFYGHTHSMHIHKYLFMLFLVSQVPRAVVKLVKPKVCSFKSIFFFQSDHKYINLTIDSQNNQFTQIKFTAGLKSITISIRNGSKIVHNLKEYLHKGNNNDREESSIICSAHT